MRVYQTVPVAIHACLCHLRDYSTAVKVVILYGGDTDTTAAIVGAAVGEAGIRKDRQSGLCDWPLSLKWIHPLAMFATENASGHRKRTLKLPFLARVFRNLTVMPVVLAHGFRRLDPPYFDVNSIRTE